MQRGGKDELAGDTARSGHGRQRRLQSTEILAGRINHAYDTLNHQFAKSVVDFAAKPRGRHHPNGKTRRPEGRLAGHIFGPAMAVFSTAEFHQAEGRTRRASRSEKSIPATQAGVAQNAAISTSISTENTAMPIGKMGKRPDSSAQNANSRRTPTTTPRKTWPRLTSWNRLGDNAVNRASPPAVTKLRRKLFDNSR